MCTQHLEYDQANIEEQDTRSFYFRIRYYTYFYIMWFLPEQILFRYQHMSNRRVVTFIFMAGVPKAQRTTLLCTRISQLFPNHFNMYKS